MNKVSNLGYKVISSDVMILNDSWGSGTYQFWPFYVLLDGTFGPYQWHMISFTSFGHDIWTENFSGQFPEDNGWTVGDSNPSNGSDYWDDKYIDNNWRGWCAGYPSSNPEYYYDNNMDAYMWKGGDYRLINLSLKLQYEQWLEPGKWDYLSLQFWTGSQWETQCKYDTGVYSWTDVNIDVPGYAFSAGSNMKVGFLFHSDESIVDGGTFLDNITLMA